MSSPRMSAISRRCRRCASASAGPAARGGSEADRNLRGDLLKELAARVTVDIPDSLVERELDRRTEEFARRLMDQQIDPRRANIDWDQFRDSQREASRESVKSALVLDEISRRENVTVSDEDVEKDVAQYAERSGLTPAAVRARLEKEGALSRLGGRTSPRKDHGLRSVSGSSRSRLVPILLKGGVLLLCQIRACSSFRWSSNKPTAGSGRTTSFRAC